VCYWSSEGTPRRPPMKAGISILLKPDILILQRQMALLR
jgi:hypothetical protein